MTAASALLQTLIFPGLLFAAVGGLLTSWVDRKLTARIQMRVGPPLLQPFYDVGKLLIKETTVPHGAPLWLFLGAPLLGLAGVTLASTITWRALLGAETGFVGDLIVLLYLLVLPPLAVVLGATASRNPLASLGASRELKLLIAYELPFIAAAIVAAVKTGSLQLGAITSAPAVADSVSGVLALAVAATCLPAKLTVVPFDLPEAETELTGGAMIEFSGPPLAVFKLTRAMMLFTLPSVLLALFGGGFGSGVAWGLIKWGLLVVLVVVVRNTTPRVRVDQAIKFFWGPVALVGVIALALANAGWCDLFENPRGASLGLAALDGDADAPYNPRMARGSAPCRAPRSLRDALAADSLTTSEATMRKLTAYLLTRSLNLFHLAGSACNNCDIEILDALTPKYDLERFGITMVGSIRHADLILLSGVFNKKSAVRLKHMIEQAPKPVLVVAVGGCPCSGIIFRDSYNFDEPVGSYIHIDAYVPGCPPKPEAIISAILKLIAKVRAEAGRSDAGAAGQASS